MHNSHLGSLPLHFHTAAGCSPVLLMNPAWSRVTGPKRFQQRSLPIESLRPLNLKVLCVFIYPNYSRLTVLAFLISCTPQEVERYRRNARDTSHACGTERNTKSKGYPPQTMILLDTPIHLVSPLWAQGIGARNLCSQRCCRSHWLTHLDCKSNGKEAQQDTTKSVPSAKKSSRVAEIVRSALECAECKQAFCLCFCVRKCCEDVVLVWSCLVLFGQASRLHMKGVATG